jgi:glycosyltransferase involved in cell wall biosynthesis
MALSVIRSVKEEPDPHPAEELGLSIVVPCFDEALGLPELVRRCSASACSVVGDSYEIILVDDGSTDGSWPVMTSLMRDYRNLIAVKLSRNFGHQVALSAGLAAIRGRVVLVIDADLQDPPELLGEMMESMTSSGADVVYGQRRSRAGESFFKAWTAKVFYRLLQRSTDVAIPLDTGDFRLMSRRIADLVAQMPERDRFISGMVASIGFKQVPFLYDRCERYAGATKYPITKMIKFAADAFFGYSMVLLRFSSIAALGLLVTLVGVAVYSLYAWAIGQVVPGWTSIMMMVILVAFFQLVALSVIGEYVGRIYLSTKSRPLFIIDRVERGMANDDVVRNLSGALR